MRRRVDAALPVGSIVVVAIGDIDVALSPTVVRVCVWLQSPAMDKHVEVSRTIAAPPEAVWAALTDVTRMGEWSPECHTCEWLDGATGPAVGATFQGENRNGELEWTTQALIMECEPPRVFAFDGVVGDYHFSQWRYVIEPSDGGCTVTEIWDEGRSDDIIAATISISGVEDRGSHNRAGMETTLERLAAAVE